MRERILSLLAMLLLVAGSALAQGITVSGKVTSADDGEPVVGASVMIKGTKTGTVTDVNGEFRLPNVPQSAKTLVISSLGMNPKEVAVKPKVNVALQPESTSIDEVMVVAFGKQKREAFTGSAGVLSADEIAQRQVSDPLTALDGKVAGLQMVESSSPGGDPSILIRGISSINASTSPLIVVDGLPYNGYYSDINPADVESISVLKDAASNALYGARGANGVILITTKSAKRGQAEISFNAKWGSNSDARVYYNTIDNPAEYYETHYRALYNYYRYGQGMDANSAYVKANTNLGGTSDNGGLGYITYSVPENQYLIGTNGRLNPAATPGNVFTYGGQEYMALADKLKDIALRHGLRQEYNLNVNGGTDKFQMLGSLGYMSNDGITYGSDYKRYTARMKADYQAREWLKVGGNMSYAHNETHSSQVLSELFTDIAYMAPIYPVYIRNGQGQIMTDLNGRMYDYGDGTVWGLQRPYLPSSSSPQSDVLDFSYNNSNAFGMQGYADITFLRDFKLTINGSVYDTENRIQYAYNPYYGYNVSSGGSVQATSYRTYAVNFQQLLNWNHSFGQHNLSVLLGHEYSRDSNNLTQGIKSKIFSYNTNKELAGAIINTSATGSSSKYNVEGYFLRANYDYKDRYYGSFSFRRDGSSNFAKGHRWGNFWSVGGAWIVSKEPWYHLGPVNMLKLKASVGQQGNDGIGSYRYTDYYALSAVNNEPALSFSTKGNEDITWETNTNVNAGVEFEMIRSRLRGSFDFYDRKTSDMLLWFTAPMSIGYSGYYDNVGDMVNRGVEFSLEGEPIKTKNITWSLNFNISHNHNEVTSLPAEKSTTTIDRHAGYIDAYRFRGEGLPVNEWYMPKYAGVDQETGLSLWYYTDSEGQRQTTTDYSRATYYLCGNPDPSVYGGFGTTLSFYGFDLGATFIFQLGGKAYDYGYANLMRTPVQSYIGNAYHKDVLKAWSQDNPTSNIPRWQFGDQYSVSQSDRFLISARQLTFKTLTLGYTLPAQWVRNLKLSSVRIFATCDNVAYWTARKGFDPRTSLTGSTSADSYPTVRTITGGISVKF